MKGLFLGAGASVECGMPLVWAFTSILSRNILSRLDIKLFNFHDDEAIKKKFASVFQSDTMHYEEMVKYLENWKLEAALLRKRIISFICDSSSGNMPINALSFGR
ncbi:hypothetical protein ACPFUZ_003416 [Vibrio cholerae]